MPFIVAAGGLLTVVPDAYSEDLDEPLLTFLAGPSNIRRALRDTKAAAKRTAKDVILLKFLAGQRVHRTQQHRRLRASRRGFIE